MFPKWLLPIGVRRLLLLAVAAVLIPVFLAMLAHHLALFRMMREREVQANLELARSSAWMFYTDVQNIARHAYALGTGLARLSPHTPEAAQAYLAANAADYPDVEAFRWLDAQGTVIASSEPGGRDIGVNLGDREYFRRVTQTGDVWYLTDLYLGQISEHDSILMARRVTDDTGELHGVMLATINRSRLAQMLKRFHRARTGRVALFDRDGTLVAIDPPVAPVGQEWRDRDAVLRQAIETGREATGAFVSPADNIRRVGARVPVGDTGWVAGASQEWRDIYGPLYRSLLAGLAWTAAVVGLSLFLAWRMNRWIHAGRSELAEHARAIAGGDLPHRARESGIREVDEVVLALNGMANVIDVAQTSLRAERAFLRHVIDATPSFVFVKNWEGQFLLGNRAVAACYGTTPEEIVGKRDADFNPNAEEVAHFQRDDRAVMSSREIKHIPEELVTCADGQTRWYSTLKVPLLNPDGTCDKVLGVATDIHDRRQSEEALRESEIRFRTLADAMPQIVWTAGADGVLDYANRRWYEYAGLPGKTAESGQWHRWVHPEDLARVQEVWQWALRTGQTRDVECRFRRHDGVYRWHLIRAVPARDGTGKILKWFGTTTDIDDMKRTEMALRESEARFRTLAEAIPAMVFTATPDGQTDYWNDLACEYGGVRREQLLGSGWMEGVHPDDLPLLVKRWGEAIAQGRSEPVEHRVRRADKVYRWHLSRAVAVRDADGRVIKWIGVSTDIDDLKRAQENLQQLADELRRSNQDLEQFAYVASHDLQGPLRVVGGYIGLILETHGDRLDAEAREFMSIAQDGALRMERLIRDLLEYARVGSRGKRPHRTDMEKVCQETLSDYRAVMEECHAVVTHDPLATVWADETQMKQLLSNLIGNAIKFRKPEEPPRIHIRVSRERKAWRFCVQDNGIGIDPQQHDRIFVIFQRLHAEERFPGTGIGLAICKKIVERHGGRIWVESAPGKGSTFCFTVPDVEEQPG